MIETRSIVAYLDELLETASISDFSGAVNGLQLGNSGSVTRVAASVDFSSRSVAAAIEEKANLLIVHHGMFWQGVRPIVGSAYSRMKSLIDADVAVYASHLPLDRHHLFGNNVLLSRQLDLQPVGEFARYKGIAIGVRGHADVATMELLDRARHFAQTHGGDAISTPIVPGRRTLNWAMCSGGGASSDTLAEIAGSNIDTLIVGEGPHWTAVEAEELGIVIIYAGHYATETLGVKALAQHVSEKFGIEWTMIHAPTGL